MKQALNAKSLDFGQCSTKLFLNSFNERVELVVEHERGSARDRAQAMASEERDLIDFFRRAEMEYEEHLVRQASVFSSLQLMCFSQCNMANNFLLPH